MHRRLRFTAALAAVALLALTACSDDDDGGDGEPAATTEAGAGDDTASVLGAENIAEGEPVKLGLVSDGQSAAIDNKIEFDVAEAAVEYLNTHNGGIGGRPIELATCESKLDPGAAADCANQMIQDDVVAVAMNAVGVMDSVWRPLNEAGVPVMITGTSNQELLKDAKSTFILGSPTSQVAGIPVGVAEKEGKSKLIAVVIDVPAATAAYLEGGSAYIAAEEAGIELEMIRIAPGTPDMTPQLNELGGDDDIVVTVLGNDSFCITAFQALIAVGYEGSVTTVPPCVTDSTREAIPGDFLAGITMGSGQPVGDPSKSQLYEAIIETYADSDVDLSRVTGHAAFQVVMALGVALEDLTGEATPATATEHIKNMEQKVLPHSGGLPMRCNGKAAPDYPAVCVQGSLTTTLDEEGNPTSYEVLNDDDIAA